MASYTATQIIEASLQALGALDAGGGASSDQKTQGLTFLQDLIDSANADPAMAISSTTVQVALSGAASYTITRYSKILSARYTMANGSGFPVRVLQDSGQFSQALDPTSSSLQLRFVWYDRLGTSPQVYTAPIVGSGTLYLTVPTPLTTFADLTTPVSMDVNHALWLKLSLAHLLASAYSLPVSKSLAEQLEAAVTRIRTLGAELLTPSAPAPPVEIMPGVAS